MYLNNFSVRVPEGDELAGGYVELDHGQVYTLRLRNDNNVRCDVRVEIDGKHVGSWRINAHDGMRLERPAHDDGRFTFYKSGSFDAKLSGDHNISKEDKGLISVTFSPEAKPEWYFTGTVKTTWDDNTIKYRTTYDDGTGTPMAYAPLSSTAPSTGKSATISANVSSGITGLSGKSDQSFGSVPPLQAYDKPTTINLRLVCKNNKPRPLTQYSTPVPPAV